MRSRIVWLLLAAPLGAEVRVDAGGISIGLDEATGQVTALRSGRSVALKPGRALVYVRDVKGTDAPVTGRVKKQGGAVVLDGVARDLGIRATVRLEAEAHRLAVGVTVSNDRQDDRGVVVSVMLPLGEKDVHWSNSLGGGSPAKDGAVYGDNLYPLSAAWGDGWGLAAAIPPTHPVMYDTHYAGGAFGVLYYIGLTPATRNFPNRAELKLVLYGVDPRWGFRSALQKYYDGYPDYYGVRAKKGGLWCFNMDAAHDAFASDCTFYEAGGAEWEGDGPRGGTEALRDKGYGRSTASTFKEWAGKNAVAEATKNGASVFPYTIAGQRQIYQLPGKELVTDYARAMKIFGEWTIDRAIPFQNPITANSFRSVDELKAIITNSGLEDAAGRRVMLPRLYTGNTLTFPLDPNPDLFRGEDKPTIAKYSLDYYVAGMVRDVPEIRGVYVDSLGRWCNYTDYRRDHFAWEKQPLGTDAEGRPVIRSLSTHYEYLQELGRRLHSGGRLLFCNGVNDGGAAKPKGGAAYDASRSASRFFLGALSDIAGSESGAKTTVARMETFRVIMGPKPFATLAKTPADDAAIEAYFKRGVMLGVFTSMGDKYYTNPELRHNAQKAHDVYLPLMRKLHEAHWRPVTGVRGLSGVRGERFGEPGQGPVYLTLLNEDKSARTLELIVELAGQLSSAVDRVTAGDRFAISSGKLSVPMAAGQLRVLELQ